MKHRILVTGSAGRLGRAAVAALSAQGHHVIGLDLRETPGLPARQSVVAPLSNLDALRHAARDVTRIIHLAATPDDAQYPRGNSPNDGDNFLEGLVPNNVIGTYQILELARTNHIPRLILASSGQVVDRHLDNGQLALKSTTTYAPRYLYACTKVMLEVMGQVYAREHAIEVIAVRLGWCPRDASQVAQIAASPDDQDVFLSPADAGRFFVASVETQVPPGFHITYATSRHVRKVLYDLGETTRLLGYHPQDTWPTGASEG